MLEKFPRANLGFWPTPVHECPNLALELAGDGGGPSIFIKRDDQSGLGLGGNKVRKLEFLVGDALNQGCDTLITGGAAQSNHCRQTAAAAAKSDLQCHLVLGGEAPRQANGNLLLDELFGAHIHWTGEHRKGEDIPDIANELKKTGKNPYIIPYGGSNAIGALGFVAAMIELKEQLSQIDTHITHIVFASSSGGTHAGLSVGARLLCDPVELYGIGIDKRLAIEIPFQLEVSRLCGDVSRLLGDEQSFQADKLILDEGFFGGGYGVVGELERSAISLLASSEGILLDPVYSGRAFGAMIELVKRKQFTRNDNLLFWHTGGTPALFPYASKII
jgi:D-cysteine desulfhydrase